MDVTTDGGSLRPSTATGDRADRDDRPYTADRPLTAERPLTATGQRKSVVNIRGFAELIEEHHEDEHDGHSDHSSTHSDEAREAVGKLQSDKHDDIHDPPSAPWLEGEGGPNAFLLPKTGSSGTQAASRSRCSTARTKQWCHAGTPFPRNPEVWRTPGHNDDALTAEAAHRKDREIQVSTRLAGEFVAGSVNRSPMTSTYLPSYMTSTSEPAMSSTSTPRRPALPTHNPYDAGWLGIAPTGCWVLDHNGRPRCVDSEQSSRQTSLANTGGSSEFRKVKVKAQRTDESLAIVEPLDDILPPMFDTLTINTDALEPAKSPIVGKMSLLGNPSPGGGGLAPQSSPCATPMRRQSCLRGSNVTLSNEVVGALNGLASSDGSSSSSSDSEDVEKSLARSCLGPDAKKALEEKKERRRFEKQAARRQSRVNFDNAALDQQQVEDIQDILQTLEEKDREASWQSRPGPIRASLLPPLTPSGFPPSPRGGDGRMTLSLYPQTPSGGTESPSMMQRPSSMGGVFGSTPVARSSIMSGAGHHGHRPSILGLKRESSLHFQKSPGSIRLHGAPLARCSIGEHNRTGLTVNRDLKAEIKRMKETLLSSAQNAFVNDVWERCGIESEHIKKHHLAQHIVGGLGGLFKKKNENDAGAFNQDQDAGSEANMARRRSMKRVSTMSSGLPSSPSQRRSVVKTAGGKRRTSGNPFA